MNTGQTRATTIKISAMARCLTSRLTVAAHLCVVLACTLSANLLHAADADPSIRTSIDNARTAIEAGNLDEAQRRSAMAQLDLAQLDDREAEAAQHRVSELRAEAVGLPSRMERLREALTLDRVATLAEWADRLPTNADAESLERVLEQERAIIAELAEQVNAAAGQLALTLSRPAQAAGEITTLRRRIEQLSVAPVVPEGDNPLLAEVRRLRQDTERRRLQAELELRLLEQDSAASRLPWRLICCLASP